MSKMEEILEAAKKAHANGQGGAAFDLLIEAIKLLSRGQYQVMTEIPNLRFSATDTKIG